VARDVDAPTAEMHQGVQDIDRGVLDMPAWILCLEHLGHLDNRGSAAALAADGGDLRDGRHRGARGLYTLQEAQDAFKDTGCELLNFGTFRWLLMRVVKTTRQRAEEQRRTTDDRKRFGKQLADRSLERKERLRHFEGIQRKQLSLVLANEVTARDRLVKIRGRLEEASSRVAHFRSQRQEKISQRMTKVEETYREHMRQVERQVARLEQDKKDKVARKALAQKEWMERLSAEKAVDAAIKHSRRLVRAELETNRQMQMQRAAAYRHAALERHLSQKALVPLVKRAQEDHLTREHKADMHAWHMQRECLSNVKETLAANGCVRAVPDMLRDNHDFAALKRFTKEAVAGEASSQFETCVQDMDPASAPLDLNSWASGEVGVGEMAGFKLFLPADAGHASLTVELRVTAGHADLFVGNGRLPRPSKANHHWAAVGCFCERNKISIHFFDENFNLGFYYLSLVGSGADLNTGGSCQFRLRWFWDTLKSPLAEVV